MGPKTQYRLPAESAVFALIVARNEWRRHRNPALSGLLRFFGIKLPDPNPELTVEKVREIHAMTYPEISTAAVEGPEPVGNRLRYTFSRAVATKG